MGIVNSGLRYRVAGLAGLLALALFAVTHAAPLSPIRDTISNSAPGGLANHNVFFRNAQEIPVSGRIVITPEATQFGIPPGLDFTDVDLLVGGADRSLAAAPGMGAGSADGVTVVSGASGSVTITLNDTDTIPAGSDVVIRIGFNATFEVAGDAQITNPGVSGVSYVVDVETQNAVAAMIDRGQTRIMILEPVTAGVGGVIVEAPTRYNGLPAMDLPSGTAAVVMSLETNIFATCRYDTVAGTLYDNMPFTFQVTPQTLHEVTLAGLVDGTTYTFYIRCENLIGMENPDDFIITFRVSESDESGTSGGSGSGSGSGSSGSGGGGGSSGSGSSGAGGPGSSGSTGQAFPPPPEDPALSMTGWTMRQAAVAISKDGQVIATGQSNIAGEFSLAVLELSQGVHTISVSATDPDGRATRALAFTFQVVGDTTNVISNVLLPPTIALGANTINPGDPLFVFGYAVPSQQVEIWVSDVGKNDARIRQVTVADANGRYELALATGGLATGSYDVRSRTFLPQTGWGQYSSRVPLGVGQQAPLDTCQRSDINRDGRVNLIDFSILLFHWSTNFPDADINGDGTVNLTDFSIMLFCWTG